MNADGGLGFCGLGLHGFSERSALGFTSDKTAFETKYGASKRTAPCFLVIDRF